MHLEHGAIKGAVDLLERELARVVDVDEGHVAQEAVREGLAARVRGRVARAHELDALEAHPRVVGGAVEAAVLQALAQEGEDALRAVLVLVGQVDLVAEDDEPLAQLGGSCKRKRLGRGKSFFFGGLPNFSFGLSVRP